MSKRLNISSALLFAIAIMPVASALLMIFSGSSEFTYEELVGVNITQISELSPKLVNSMELAIQVRGLYLLVFTLLWSVIVLIPYRKGEKWAWYAIFGIGSIWLIGYIVLVCIGIAQSIYLSTWLVPGIIWLVLWVIGLALPSKEIFVKLH